MTMQMLSIGTSLTLIVLLVLDVIATRLHTRAVKRLIAEIDALEERIEALEERAP